MKSEAEVYEIVQSADESFHEDPMAYLAANGVPEKDYLTLLGMEGQVHTDNDSPAEVTGSAAVPVVTAKTLWSGVALSISHQGCLDIESGNIKPIKDIVETIPVIGKAVGVLISLSLLALKARIKALDKGVGVHIVIYWPAFATFVAVATVTAYFLAGLRSGPYRG